MKSFLRIILLFGALGVSVIGNAQIGILAHYDDHGLAQLLINHRDHGVKAFYVKYRLENQRKKYHYEFLNDTVFAASYDGRRRIYEINGSSFQEIPADYENYVPFNSVVCRDSVGYKVCVTYTMAQRDTLHLLWSATRFDTLTGFRIRYLRNYAMPKLKWTEYLQGDTLVLVTYFNDGINWVENSREKSWQIITDLSDKHESADYKEIFYNDPNGGSGTVKSAVIRTCEIAKTGLITSISSKYVENGLPKESMGVLISRQRRYVSR